MLVVIGATVVVKSKVPAGTSLQVADAVLFLVTEWSHYAQLDLKLVQKKMGHARIVDGRNL